MSLVVLSNHHSLRVLRSHIVEHKTISSTTQGHMYHAAAAAASSALCINASHRHTGMSKHTVSAMTDKGTCQDMGDEEWTSGQLRLKGVDGSQGVTMFGKDSQMGCMIGCEAWGWSALFGRNLLSLGGQGEAGGAILDKGLEGESKGHTCHVSQESS